ncbi:hypothetical protein [Streptomyces sp. SID8374]|uniref:hypothetical protein n=1 Tax=Streptomyces sp. SID8374 TaxID=2690354 RepID=UPI001F3BA9EA|nr:hypothetical protein [Streptomyces sp. SID8374]
MTGVGDKTTGQGWEGCWYRVRADRFEASFLPGADEDLDAVCDVDVEVRLAADGSRWSATVFTLAEVGRRSGQASRRQRICRPEIARAMTSRWISLVPSKMV